MNLQVVGKWSGFASPVVTGSAQLRAVSAQLDALPSPLQIASADLTLPQDSRPVLRPRVREFLVSSRSAIAVGAEDLRPVACVGCGRGAAAKTGHIGIAEIVGHNEHDVRYTLFLVAERVIFATEEQNDSREAKEQLGNSVS